LLSFKNLLLRIEMKYHRLVAQRLHRRMMPIKTETPIISFSFDDAPRTAFRFGGDILKAYGAEGTFYVSLGMLGRESASGTIAFEEDLHKAIEQGHELGCHTFGHMDPWGTSTDIFIKSVLKNREILHRIIPKAAFNSFAYPYQAPKPGTKKRVGTLFGSCRGGGQDLNKEFVDMNLVKSFFLDRRTGIKLKDIKKIIDDNLRCKGWLVFSTHDVDNNPSPYGCTIEFFEKIVAYAVGSGAFLLSVGKACEKIQRCS
jgi:peptidoglycan/xylan/chitin deacetylase (PgdA/CDA1 family)